MEPPEVKFIHKIALPQVDMATGVVEVTALPECNPWDPCESEMDSILKGLLNSMNVNRNVNQPEKDSIYDNPPAWFVEEEAKSASQWIDEYTS